MSEVSIDFNAGGNLGASLTQLIQQSTQAAQVTDGLVGQIGRLNAVTMALVSRTAGLTGANKVATAQAAAYQEAMSGIAATAAVTGQSFQKLEQTTLQLARSIPGGIGEAVRIVQTLQSSGVTAEKQIAKLGETFAKLGEANGTDGAALGKQLLSLNRIFGNSEESLSKYGDSLTAVSKRFGASAADTAAFAKALAPVASSVGMSETAVLGLSAAAARLGEDGYAGANAFNKVLLDMQRSVRDGTPELQSYAKMLNLSSDSLRNLFKADPTEVLVRFTEAIKKNSPETQRGLEKLGFDSTRTIRSLQAISSQGNLRQVVEQSASDFGGGSTSKGASEAIGGVNAQAKMLAETLSQTVAAAGKPFLGWLEQVMRLANDAAGAITGLMQSTAVQTIGKVAAPVSFVASAGAQALSIASVAGLGMSGYRALFGKQKVDDQGQVTRNAGFFPRISAAAADAAKTGSTSVDGIAGTLGKFLGNNGFSPQSLSSTLSVPGGMSPMDYVRTAYRGGANFAATYVNTQTASIDRGLGNDVQMSEGGKAGLATLKEGARTAVENFAQGQAQKGLEKLGEVIGKSTKEWLNADGAMKNFGKSIARAGVALLELSVAAIKAAATKFLGFIGGGSVATGGAMVGGLAVAAGAYMGYRKFRDNQNELEDNANKGFTDANGKFNDFAAAAGLASKGLLSLAEVSQKTAKELSSANKTAVQAFKYTTEEFSASKATDYKRAFTVNDTDPKKAALEARLMLGANASPEAIARVGMDYGNQTNDRTMTQTMLDELSKLNGQKDVSSEAVKSLGENKDWRNLLGGMSQGQSDILNGMNAEQTKKEASVAQTYGEEAAQVERTRGVSQTWKEASAGDNDTKKRLSESLAKEMGIQDPNIVYRALANGYTEKDFIDELRANKEGAGSWQNTAKQNAIKATSGTDGSPGAVYMPTKTEEYSYVDTYDKYAGKSYASVATNGVAETASQRLEDSFDSVISGIGKGGKGLTEALYGTAHAIRKFGEDGKFGGAGDWTSKAAIAVDNYMNNVTPQTRGTAGAYLAKVATDRYGNDSTASLALLQQKSGMTDDVQRNLMAEAQSNINYRAPIKQMTTSLAEQSAESRPAAAQARAMGQLDNPEDDAQRRAMIDKDRDLYAQRLSIQKQFVLASRQLDRQLARQDEEAAITQKRAADDYATQTRDAEKDYTTSVARANEDYHQSTARANEDFNLQQSRATRDFHKQEARAQEDFNTSRARSIRDFNKNLRRLMEDQAASIYDPYKRIQAQQVWDAKSLLTNLQQQNEALVKQTQNLAKARALGVSQQVLDQLKLSDAGNAQQLERLLADLQSNPNLVGQLNSTATTRAGAAEDLTKEGPGYKRQVEDFNQGLKDSAADFKKSSARATADFNTAMSDSLKDFTKAMTRGAADFVKQMSRGEADYHKTLARAERQYHLTLTRMDADLARSRKHAQEDLVHMAEDTSGGVEGLYKEFTERTKNLPAGIKAQFSANLLSVVKSAGTDLSSYLATKDSPYQVIADWFLAAGGKSGAVNTDESNRGRARDANASTAPGARHADGAIVTSPEYAMIGEAGPEAVIPLNYRGINFVTGVMQRSGMGDGWDKNAKLEEERKKADQEKADDRKKADERKKQDQAHNAAKMTAHTAHLAHTAHMQHMAHLQRMARIDDTAKTGDMNHNLISNRRNENDRRNEEDRQREDDQNRQDSMHGTRTGRMTTGVSVQPVEANFIRALNAARHSSPVTNNHTYDHRTQIMGPVTVQADDPNKFAAELKRRVAHARLVSPGRAGITGGVA